MVRRAHLVPPGLAPSVWVCDRGLCCSGLIRWQACTRAVGPRSQLCAAVVA